MALYRMKHYQKWGLLYFGNEWLRRYVFDQMLFNCFLIYIYHWLLVEGNYTEYFKIESANADAIKSQPWYRKFEYDDSSTHL